MSFSIAPVSGFIAASFFPWANQTCVPSWVTPWTPSTGNGPYSRTTVAFRRALADWMDDAVFMVELLRGRVLALRRVLIYGAGGLGGSNKSVGISKSRTHRRPRPLPVGPTFPALCSSPRLRCTVRSLTSSASASDDALQG